MQRSEEQNDTVQKSTKDGNVSKCVWLWVDAFETVGLQSYKIFLTSEITIKVQVSSGREGVLVSAAAGKKSATRLPLPPPGGGGEWKERGRNWWVGIRAV